MVTFAVLTYSFDQWTRTSDIGWKWESQFLGRLIRSLWSPRRRKESGALEEEIGFWSCQGGEKDKSFFFKPRADDCTTKQLILLKDMLSLKLSSIQSLSCVRLFGTPWTAAHQASLSITTSQSLLKLMSIELVMPSNHLILCYPLLLLPSIFPSIRVFSSESVFLIRWPKYWSFSFSISLSNEYSGLISFRTDWLDILSVQGTLKSLLQHYSSKASILRLPAL